MKKVILFATALVAMVSCTSDGIVGENNNSPNLDPAPNAGEKAIVFNSGTNAITRATHTGSDAASMLNNQFIFAGTKGESASAYVFDQYIAKWVQNTANTTQSNSNDWEYVSYTPAGSTTLPSGAVQSIKYWDYSTTQYDFAAYSTGSAVAVYNTDPAPGQVKVSAIAADSKEYTITGSVDDLKKCYISDLVTAYNRDGVNDYGNVVTFSFRSLATKIRLAFYETVPGYAVKDVKFYSVASGGEATNTPTLFTSSAVLPSGSGTMTISFPTTGFEKRPGGSSSNTDYNKAHVSFAQESGVDATSTLVLGALTNYPTDYEGVLSTGNYLGRTSSTATYADGYSSGTTPNPKGTYFTILPKENGANLQLRIKYTLVSTDGSNEEMTVNNATAVVPAELAQWNPNYAYTYIFKISDMTNGTTGVDGDGNTVTGLTPITLNAVVVDSEDGLQETITTVSEPSITTYTQGKVVTVNNEYLTNANIYIIVNDGSSNVAYDAAKFKLYTATIESGAAQTLQEASVDNAFKNGTYDNTAKTYTVHDANGKDLVLTESYLLGASTQIEATDSPTGNLITVNGAKFKPTIAGTYVFQYEKTAPVCTAVTNGTTLTSGKKYYTSASGAGIFTSNGTEVADGTNYFTLTTPGEYQYKIIIVQ